MFPSIPGKRIVMTRFFVGAFLALAAVFGSSSPAAAQTTLPQKAYAAMVKTWKIHDETTAAAAAAKAAQTTTRAAFTAVSNLYKANAGVLVAKMTPEALADLTALLAKAEAKLGAGDADLALGNIRTKTGDDFSAEGSDAIDELVRAPDYQLALDKFTLAQYWYAQAQDAYDDAVSFHYVTSLEASLEAYLMMVPHLPVLGDNE